MFLHTENQELYSGVGFPLQAKKSTLKIRRLLATKSKMMGGQEVSGAVERNGKRWRGTGRWAVFT
jgi:hypothetical protein